MGSSCCANYVQTGADLHPNETCYISKSPKMNKVLHRIKNCAADHEIVFAGHYLNTAVCEACRFSGPYTWPNVAITENGCIASGYNLDHPDFICTVYSGQLKHVADIKSNETGTKLEIKFPFKGVVNIRFEPKYKRKPGTLLWFKPFSFTFDI